MSLFLDNYVTVPLHGQGHACTAIAATRWPFSHENNSLHLPLILAQLMDDRGLVLARMQWVTLCNTRPTCLYEGDVVHHGPAD